MYVINTPLSQALASSRADDTPNQSRAEARLTTPAATRWDFLEKAIEALMEGRTRKAERTIAAHDRRLGTGPMK